MDFDGLITMRPAMGIALADTIDQRDEIIDKLLAEKKRDANNERLARLEYENKELNERVAILVNQIKGLGSYPAYGSEDVQSREQKCVDFLTRENTVDISFFRGKINDVNMFLDPIMQKNPATLTPQEKSKIRLLRSQKRVLIGEYAFNNMLAKHMGEYYCDRILNN